MGQSVKKNRIGESYYDKKRNDNVTIVEYNGYHDMIVEFENTKTRVKVEYSQFKKQNIKDPMYRDSLGIGYLGIGKHKSNRHNPFYRRWFAMLQRCYDETSTSYKPGKEVCEEWHNFQNFADWMEEHWYEVEGETMCIDKDILSKGSKLYSPETCCIVPMEINNAFNYANTYLRFKEDKNGCYSVKANSEYIGYAHSREEAWNLYVKHKEAHVKNLANKYKEVIEPRVYETLMSYKVPESLKPKHWEEYKI